MSARDVVVVVVRVYAAAIAATLLVAAVVLAVGAHSARDWLDFPFTGVPATASQAVAIFANNARVMLAALAGAAVLNARCLTTSDLWPAPGVGWRVTRLLCDVTLTVGVAVNVLIVGAALGAYRARMVAAILPHGPVELLGFACALTLYLLARRGPQTVGTWLLLAGSATAALAAGALLEVFVARGSWPR